MIRAIGTILTIQFSNEKIYWWKLMWADFNIELPWLDSNYFDKLNDKSKHLVFFLFDYISQLFAYFVRIFALKKNFLTSSKHFIETNLRKHVFELATNHIYINMKCLDDVRHSQYFKFVSWAFHGVMAPKKLVFERLPKTKRLETKILKNLIQICFLPNFWHQSINCW